MLFDLLDNRIGKGCFQFIVSLRHLALSGPAASNQILSSGFGLSVAAIKPGEGGVGEQPVYWFQSDQQGEDPVGYYDCRVVIHVKDQFA